MSKRNDKASEKQRNEAVSHILKVTARESSATALAQCSNVEHATDDMGLMFEMFDIDQDGKIDVADLAGVFEALGLQSNLPQYSLPGKAVSDMIDEGDEDGDGCLSKEEFIEYMRVVSKHLKAEEENAKKKAIARAAQRKVTAASRRTLMVARLKGEITDNQAEKAGLMMSTLKAKRRKKQWEC